MRNKNEEWNEDEYTDVTEEKAPSLKGFDMVLGVEISNVTAFPLSVDSA